MAVTEPSFASIELAAIFIIAGTLVFIVTRILAVTLLDYYSYL
jgi:hypothetical protein